MSISDDERVQLKALYNSMTAKERQEIQEVIEKIEQDHQEFLRSLRKFRILFIASALLVLMIVVSVILRFIYPGWETKIFDGCMNFASSILTFTVFIATHRTRYHWSRWLLLGLTALNIGFGLNTWGVF